MWLLVIFLTIILAACNGESEKEEVKKTKETTDKVESAKELKDEETATKEEVHYLYPKTKFDELDSVIYEDGNGKVRAIGFGTLNEDSLLALRFEGDLVNDWRSQTMEDSLLITTVIFDDGSYLETDLNYQDILYNYKDKDHNTIVIFKIGAAKQGGVKVARIDYKFELNGETKSVEIKNTNKIIELLGVQEGSFANGTTNIVIEDETKKVVIDSYSYLLGSVSLTGSVEFKNDAKEYENISALYVPTTNTTYTSDYSKEDYYKGIPTRFSMYFKTEPKLTVEDTYAELYLFGLATTLNFTDKKAYIPKSKDLLLHPLDRLSSENKNLIPSPVRGFMDLSNTNNHNALSIKMMTEASTYNLTTIDNYVQSDNYLDLGTLFEKVEFDVKVANSLSKYPDVTAPDLQNMDTHIYFYALVEPTDLEAKRQYERETSNGDEGNPETKAKADRVKLIKEIAVPHNGESVEVELNTSDINYLGIRVNGPMYTVGNFMNDFGQDILLTNGKLYYK